MAREGEEEERCLRDIVVVVDVVDVVDVVFVFVVVVVVVAAAVSFVEIKAADGGGRGCGCGSERQVEAANERGLESDSSRWRLMRTEMAESLD